MKQNIETLNYARVARKAKDGSDGFLYLHSWGSGCEYLIFPTHEAAEKYKALLNDPERLAAYLEKPA